MQTLVLDGSALTIPQLVDVVLHGRTVALAAAARERMLAAHELVMQIAGGDAAVYGINTGFGQLSRVQIAPVQLAQLQINLLRSHAAGVGDPLPAGVVRALMLISAASLARGHSGVHPRIVEQFCALLNAGIHAAIPSRGSVGASGDLAPLAHLALLLVGEGQALAAAPAEADMTLRLTPSAQPVMPAALALATHRLAPLQLGPKEGLALINGTHLMAAYGALLLHAVDRLLEAALLAGAMSLEAARGSAAPLDPRLHALRPQSGQLQAAARLAELAAGSQILYSHADCGRVQDPYSLRCMPQVFGAVLDGVAFARGIIERELGAVTDNPLCFPNDGAVISGGNFHGQPLALALDVLGIALTQLAAFSERRIYLLVSVPEPAMELPAFLTSDSGLCSGLMITQYVAAALVNECQGLAVPASISSIPTSAGMEDYVSMGATAALKAAQILEQARRVVAIELLCAAQGLDYRRPLQAGPRIERAHRIIRQLVAPLQQDRALSGEIEALAGLIAAGGLRGGLGIEGLASPDKP